ncbi:MAG: ATP-binding protein [Solirubrobacterales bacterium]
MNDAEFHRQLVNNCSWWRKPHGWELDDPDLRGIRDSRLDYEPEVLKDIVPDGLYVLRGPRRVGKSVEIKRAIAELIHSGVQPRQIIHFACDGLRPRELRQVERVGRDQATAGVEGPRYWFLDEITAVQGWPSEIKWLRDNTTMRRDCVVLTGSSSLDLEEARNELAGRRGDAGRSDRLLLPMSFRSFFGQLHHDAPPSIPIISAKDFLGREREEAVFELQPWLDQLASAWEVYCRCGGFPAAVEAQIAQGEVSRGFVNDLWDVISGDAMRRGNFNATQTLALVLAIGKGLSSFTNMSNLGRELGVDHTTAARRVRDLVENYLAWPCHQRGAHGLPRLGAQSKYYFIDPLLARLAHLRVDRLPEPDTSAVSEQQIGLHLIRGAIQGDPGVYAAFSSVMCARNASRKEVDFVGPTLGGLGFEGKYSDIGLERESATVRSICGGQGVMASRTLIGRASRGDVVFIPSSFVAYLLSE